LAQHIGNKVRPEKFGGLCACGATFPYTVTLPIFFQLICFQK
jgi:hypothetical protein